MGQHLVVRDPGYLVDDVGQTAADFFLYVVHVRLLVLVTALLSASRYLGEGRTAHGKTGLGITGCGSSERAGLWKRPEDLENVPGLPWLMAIDIYRQSGVSRVAGARSSEVP
ncbi:hypothetical protein GCM10017771_64630 [Streptomyces capitiformicae]|uniref:Uncharacterized protein n=1 Tax=Streptomyces capitiformicae TaxID=2014920 RepID=A0A918ZBB8_9ACTN|nr:hypothetical protein GCM10017771_64630 [Streptomyces capitiformicae]